jgi:hypothetical protein
MIETIHSYPVKESETTYNIKWTILSHIKYWIGKEKKLIALFDGVLHNVTPAEKSFVDFLPEEAPPHPLFACDFLGFREFDNNVFGRMFAVQYRGVKINFKPSNKFGENNANRGLEFLHDTLIKNFSYMSIHAGIEIYNFTIPDRIPVGMKHKMAMYLEESLFEFDPDTLVRRNGINWIFRVHEL